MSGTRHSGGALALLLHTGSRCFNEADDLLHVFGRILDQLAGSVLVSKRVATKGNRETEGGSIETL